MTILLGRSVETRCATVRQVSTHRGVYVNFEPALFFVCKRHYAMLSGLTISFEPALNEPTLMPRLEILRNTMCWMLLAGLNHW
jgi:hypothetical protein